ncbi:unnamed protein product [Mesocestoides corti]|uniref:Ig-like domain-containing protein n=1 Tax=Mesocestoides corti TaxID=53468 RepID=A0A0R3URK5_MESCO|nr:unnamed protein product [Mesocestoides corti]
MLSSTDLRERRLMQLEICHLVLLSCALAARCAEVVMPVFSNYVMPCNISELPQPPDRELFLWFQDSQLIRAVNPFLLAHGEIEFRQLTPSAAGVYLCCYGGAGMRWCADEIHLRVLSECHDSTRRVSP